jgi:hypothetical protein
MVSVILSHTVKLPFHSKGLEGKGMTNSCSYSTSLISYMKLGSLEAPVHHYGLC